MTVEIGAVLVGIIFIIIVAFILKSTNREDKNNGNENSRTD